MKLNTCFPALLIFALGILPGFYAIADDQPLLKKFDTNKDKVLADKEIPEMLRSRMQRFDTDDDGTLNAAELATLPDRAVSRLLGNTPGNSTTPSAGGNKPGSRPGEVVAPAAREEFDEPTLEVGDAAPDFTLPREDGKGDITLSSFKGEKPVVLVFGSITCSPFRQKVAGVAPIFEKYKDQADFLMVYIREAHPESIVEVPSENGDKQLKKFVQTDDFESRLESAQFCSALIKMPFPTVVDGEDNRIKEAYAGWPIRLLVVDIDGKIAFDGGRGPRGFEPQKLDAWLGANL